MEIDEVAAGIIKRRERAPFGLGGLHAELNAQILQSLVLLLNIVRSERRGRYPLREQNFLERRGSRVGVGLEKQLEIVRPFGRDDGQPFEFLA